MLTMRPVSPALFYSHYLDHMTNTDSSGNKETIKPYLLLNSQRPPNECKSLTQRFSHSRIVKVCLDFRGQKKSTNKHTHSTHKPSTSLFTKCTSCHGTQWSIWMSSPRCSVLWAAHTAIWQLCLHRLHLPTPGADFHVVEDIKGDGDGCPLTGNYKGSDAVPLPTLIRVPEFAVLMRQFSGNPLRHLSAAPYFSPIWADKRWHIERVCSRRPIMVDEPLSPDEHVVRH